MLWSDWTRFGMLPHLSATYLRMRRYLTAQEFSGESLSGAECSLQRLVKPASFPLHLVSTTYKSEILNPCKIPLTSSRVRSDFRRMFSARYTSCCQDLPECLRAAVDHFLERNWPRRLYSVHTRPCYKVITGFRPSF